MSQTSNFLNMSIDGKDARDMLASPMQHDHQNLSAPATKGDLLRFATKDDLLELHVSIQQELNRRFEEQNKTMNERFEEQDKTMNASFAHVLVAIENTAEDIKKENKKSKETLEQDFYNKMKDQDVIITRHDTRLQTVERRLGIAA